MKPRGGCNRFPHTSAEGASASPLYHLFAHGGGRDGREEGELLKHKSREMGGIECQKARRRSDPTDGHGMERATTQNKSRDHKYGKSHKEGENVKKKITKEKRRKGEKEGNRKERGQ